MFTLPAWDAVHPLIVHFPIALLFTAPLFIIAAIFWRSAWKPLSAAALAVLVLGTAGAAIAVATGEAGEDAAKAIPAAGIALERHEELGELTRNIFVALTTLFAAITMMGLLVKLRGRQLFAIASLVFLLPYAGGVLLLARTAHEGGLLVHQHGVHAPIAGAETPRPDVARYRDDD